MSTPHNRRFKGTGVVLLTLVLLPGLVMSVAGQMLLGEAGHYSLTYTVFYQGLPQPGGSVTFLNALSNSYYVNKTLTNPRITAVEIFTALGNYSVPGPYPIYFTAGDRLLNQTVQIPGSTALGRYAVTAAAFYQLSYITFQGEVWYDAPPLVVRGSIVVTTPLDAAVSYLLTGLARYWPPLLLTYSSGVLLFCYLAVASDRKKQELLRIRSLNKAQASKPT